MVVHSTDGNAKTNKMKQHRKNHVKKRIRLASRRRRK
jgi:hypothetical protein